LVLSRGQFSGFHSFTEQQVIVHVLTSCMSSDIYAWSCEVTGTQ